MEQIAQGGGGILIPESIQETTGHGTLCCSLLFKVVVVSQRLDLMTLILSNLNDFNSVQDDFEQQTAYWIFAMKIMILPSFLSSYPRPQCLQWLSLLITHPPNCIWHVVIEQQKLSKRQLADCVCRLFQDFRALQTFSNICSNCKI